MRWQAYWLRAGVISRMLPRLADSEIRVMITLLIHADTSGQAWPSVQTIADLAGLGRRTVQLALGRLVDAGVIRRLSHSQRLTETYVFDVSAGREIPGGTTSSQASGGAHRDARGGALGCAGGRTGVRPIVEERTEEQSSIGVSEIHGELPGNDDDCLASPDAKTLFEAREAIDSLVDIGFCRRDADKQLRLYGAAAIRQTLEKLAFFQSRGIKVAGKPITNARAFVVSDLRSGFGPDHRVLAARKAAQDAAAAQTAREVRESREAAQRERQATDEAMRRMILATMPAEALEKHRQAALKTLPGFIARSLQHVPADDPRIVGAVIDQVFGKDSKP